MLSLTSLGIVLA